MILPDYSEPPADLSSLIGQTIGYLRKCDIDHTGHGHFFPKIGKVRIVSGDKIAMSDGTIISKVDLVAVKLS